MRRRLATLLFLALAGFGALLVYGHARRHPEDVPWTALDLAQPVGSFTGRKLAGIEGGRCQALLSRAGVRFTRLPDRGAGPGCGYEHAVRFAPGGATSIGYRPADLGMQCPVAAALALWEWHVVQPAAQRHFGRPVSRIDHYGSYSCRRLYGRRSGGWSEHAHANAVDIAGFTLAGGRRIVVLTDWRRGGAEGAFLHDVRDGACRLFSTVLSPDYNNAHGPGGARRLGMAGLPMSLTEPLTEVEIAEARARIAGIALRTPLVPMADGRSWLKLECLQPTGSYKIRGATNLVGARDLAGPIVSASAGNFGQALAAAARRRGLQVTIHVPDNAARVKLANLKRLGAEVRAHSHEDWWRIMATRDAGDAEATFIHPVCEREMIAGAATIGAEIVEDLPEVAAVLIPIGGGGLAAGIAQAVKLKRPRCRIVAVETDTATPLKAALAAGAPVTVARTASFIDGMGSTRVLDAMWPLLERLIDQVVVVGIAEVEAAIRRLAAEHRVIAEGAGAAAVAAAKVGTENAVAIVSGGNIDADEFARILAG